MQTSFKIALIVCGIAAAAVLFIFSPFFYTKNITVEGCEAVTESDIITKAGLDSTTNLLLFNANKARKNIMENIYIDDVLFRKQYPNTLTVIVRERHLSGYVEYMQGKYLYIDENGRVLEINTFFTEKLPMVSGLKYTSVRLGEILEVEDAAAFKIVVTYAKLLNKHDIINQVSRIDVSDGENTRILLHHIDFNVGDGKNADEKVRTIKEIFDNMPDAENMKGFVDIKEIKEQYYFKMLM